MKMVLKLLPGLLLAAACSAQPAFLAGPKVVNISHSTVRVVWITTAHPTSSEIEWGPAVSYGNTKTALAYNSSPYTSSVNITGLSPNTLYHCRARLNAGAVLSSDVTFTTAPAPSGIVADPAAPATVDTTMPAINGNTYSVDSTCSNLQSILNTLAGLTGGANHEVVIPAGTSCYGNWTFPARPTHTGWVVVRSSAAGTAAFPPEGVRWTTNWPVASTLASFVTRALGSSRGSQVFVNANPCANYYGEGALYFVIQAEYVAEFPLLRCSDNYPAYSGDPLIDSMSGSLPVTVTATGHGLVEGQLIYIPANGYVASGQYYVYDNTADTFKIYAAGSGSYTGAVSFTVRNQFRTPPHTESGSDPSGACTEEQWHWNNSAKTLWWCVEGTWTRFEFPGGSDSLAAAINVQGNQYRFVGIEARTQPVAGAPDSFPAGWDQPGGLTNQQGIIANLVLVNGSNTIFDRCYLHGQPKPGRLHKVFSVNKDDFALINSTLADSQEWRSGGYWQGGGSIGVTHYAGHRLLLGNNLLEVAGIQYYSFDPNTNGTAASDVTVERNTFRKQPSWRRTTGPYHYPNRHAFEPKAGHHIVLKGNRFEYNWAGLNAGAFILLSPHSQDTMPGPWSILTWSNSVFQLSGAAYAQAGDVVYVTGTDAQHNGLWEVASNGCPSNCAQFTVVGSPTGSGSGGSAQVRAFGLGMSDILVESNTFYQGTEVLRMAPFNSGSNNAYRLPVSRRLKVYNNLAVDLNIRAYASGGRVDSNSTFVNGDNGARMVAIVGGEGEDFQVRHNTWYGARGNLPTFLLNDNSVAGGLWFSDNMFLLDETGLNAVRGGSSQGTATLNDRWQRDGMGYWTSTGNLICCGKSGSAGSYPSGYQWPATEADVKWLKAGYTAPYDFRLRYDSPYISGGAQRASDDRDIGVDLDALEAAQGRVGNPRVHGLGPTSATLAYLAPDEAACTLEVSTSATWGTGTRLSDGGGGRVRNIPVSGLASGTLYHYRVLCPTEQPYGSFLTP